MDIERIKARAEVTLNIANDEGLTWPQQSLRLAGRAPALAADVLALAAEVERLPRWYSVHRVGQLRRGQGPAVASAAILGWARVMGK
jgi:uncharacterized protein (DUF849 family)